MLRGLANIAKGNVLSVDILLQIHAVSSVRCVKYLQKSQADPHTADKENVSGFLVFLRWDVQKAMLPGLEMFEEST